MLQFKPLRELCGLGVSAVLRLGRFSGETIRGCGGCAKEDLNQQLSLFYYSRDETGAVAASKTNFPIRA